MYFVLARLTPSRGSVAALFMGLALGGTACGSDTEGAPSEHQHPVDVGCEGRGEPIALGMIKHGGDGRVVAELAAAAPLPPETGDNAWTVRLGSNASEPVTGAVVVAQARMVDHTHNSPSQQGVEAEPGVYDFSPIALTMAGYWQVRLIVTGAPPFDDEVLFHVCVER